MSSMSALLRNTGGEKKKRRFPHDKDAAKIVNSGKVSVILFNKW